MTTTAFDDQFGESTEKHVAIQPYDIAAILRQNVADLQRELQRQRERADKAEATLKESQERHAAATARLRDQIERVTSEWERADKAVAEAREDLQVWIDSRNGWMERAHDAEAELKKSREQEPVLYWEGFPCFTGSPKGETKASFQQNAVHSYPLYTRPIPAPAPAVPEGDDFNGTTPHMIQCIESLVNMSDRGVLVPHGLCGHSRTLLLASANRLRQQAVPAVPEEWRDVLNECADDLAIELDQRYGESRKYPSEQRKYEAEMQPVYRARALLQSAGGGK